MPTVQDLLSIKGRTVYTTRATETAYDALTKMMARDVGSLVVLNSDNLPCGMFTERDYLRRVALDRRSPKATFVQEVMSRDLVYVDLATDLEECMSLMTHRKIRHLPILEEGVLLGIISTGDIIEYMARGRKNASDRMVFPLGRDA